MAFFIPKDVVEKLKQAEEINDFSNNLEKLKNLTEKFATQHSNQFGTSNSHSFNKASDNSCTQDLLNISNHITALNENFKNLNRHTELLEQSNHITAINENLKKLNKYTELLEQSNKIDNMKNAYQDTHKIDDKIAIFDSLRKVGEDIKVYEDISSNFENSSSSKYLRDFLKKVRNE